MYPKEYQFADGNPRPNKLQESLFLRLDEYAGVVAQKRKGNRLVVVFNGDAIDGRHHDTDQLHTRKLSEQRDMFADVFDHFLKRVGYDQRGGDQIYFVEGTTLNRTHGSPEDTDEIARDFGAVPFRPPPDGDDKGGWYPWQVLDLDVRGHLFRIIHHPLAALGKLPHTRGNAIRSRVRGLQYGQVARGKPIPRFLVWGHTHIGHREVVEFNNGTPRPPVTTAIALPCFQFPTEYVDQRMPWDSELTTIGAWWATISQDGSQVDNDFEFAELPHRREPEKI